MQVDGNLVLYRTSDNKALWSTGTRGTIANVVCMTANGDLILYLNGGGGIWASKTIGYTGAILLVKNDGNLVVSAETDVGEMTVWQTDTQGPCIGKNTYQ
jgi:hypothetical protein